MCILVHSAHTQCTHKYNGDVCTFTYYIQRGQRVKLHKKEEKGL